MIMKKSSLQKKSAKRCVEKVKRIGHIGMGRKNVSAFWLFFVTSILIITFPTILSFSFLHHSVSYMLQQEDLQRVRQQEELSQIVNVSYKDAYQLGYKVAVNSLVRTYSISNNRDSDMEYQILNYLKNIVNNTEFYNNCFVRFPQYDRIISVTQSSTTDNYLTEIYRKEKDAIEKILASDEEKGLVVAKSEETGKKHLFFVRSISSNTGVGEPAKVFIELNLSYIEERMELFLNENDVCLFGMPEDYIFCAGTALKETEAQSLYATIHLNTENFSNTEKTYGEHALYALPINAEKLALYYMQGETSAWKIYFRTFSFVGIEIIVCIVISMTLVYYFSRYHTKKLQFIIQALSREGQNEIQTDRRNEYEQILSYVDSYQQDYEDAREQSAKYRQACQGLYMRNLLSGNVLKKDSIRDTMQLYEIDLPYEYYEILLFYEDSETNDELSDDGLSDEVEIRVMADAIRTEIMRWTSAEDKLFLTEKHGNYVCMLNYETISEKNEEYAQKLAKNILQILNSFGISHYQFKKSGIFKGADKMAEHYEKMNQKSAVETKPDSSEEKIGKYVQQCLEIIRSQYQDKALSTDSIAEQLQISRSHLSSLFKQQIGIGLLDYIHRYRINEFKKEIQKNPKARLHEMAEQTGFSNQAALIRVFKKIEGVTPGQYRDEILQNTLKE